MHGYAEAGLTGDVEVRAEIDEEELRLYLEDSAMPYDPLEQPPPDGMDLPLEERALGGLGVYLAIDGVDEFRYERVDNRNRNIFTVRRPTATADESAARRPPGA